SWRALARRAARICLPKQNRRCLNCRRPPNSAGPVSISASTPAAGSIISAFSSPSSCREGSPFMGRAASRPVGPSAASRPDSITATRSGVPPHVGAVGIGLEYAIAPHFTVKVEYLYDFINARPVVSNPVPSFLISFGTRTDYHVARIGLNYHFDWLSTLAAPV